MGEARLHAVLGTGQAGSALAEELAVSRNRPLAGGIDWRAADAADPEVAADAPPGASVVTSPFMPRIRSGRSGSRRSGGRAGCRRAPRRAAGGAGKGYGPAEGKANTPREKEKGS